MRSLPVPNRPTAFRALLLGELAQTGTLDWADINRLGARHLLPREGDTSRLAHRLAACLSGEPGILLNLAPSRNGEPVVRELRLFLQRLG